jgi:hypothetical protein
MIMKIKKSLPHNIRQLMRNRIKILLLLHGESANESIDRLEPILTKELVIPINRSMLTGIVCQNS